MPTARRFQKFTSEWVTKHSTRWQAHPRQGRRDEHAGRRDGPNLSADSGSTYLYDSTAQQYIYNWKTSTGGNYWQIGVRLDDGQTYFVNIGLR